MNNQGTYMYLTEERGIRFLEKNGYGQILWWFKWHRKCMCVSTINTHIYLEHCYYRKGQ